MGALSTAIATGVLLVEVEPIGWADLLVAGKTALLLVLLEEVALIFTSSVGSREKGVKSSPHLNMQLGQQARDGDINPSSRVQTAM